MNIWILIGMYSTTCDVDYLVISWLADFMFMTPISISLYNNKNSYLPIGMALPNINTSCVSIYFKLVNDEGKLNCDLNMSNLKRRCSNAVSQPLICGFVITFFLQ